MPDQDQPVAGQQTSQDVQKAPPGSLPGSAFVPALPSLKPGNLELPGWFYNLPPDKQAELMKHPELMGREGAFLSQRGSLPRDLPEKMAVPMGAAIGATAITAAQAIPGVPESEGLWWLLSGLGAGVGGAGGSLYKSELQKAGKSEEAPKGWKEEIEQAGIDGYDQAKTELMWGGIGRVLTGTLARLTGVHDPAGSYQKALKPPTSWAPERVQEAVETGLTEHVGRKVGPIKLRGVPLNAKGVGMVTQTIDFTNQEIANEIAQLPTNVSAGRYIQNVEQRFDLLRKKYGARALSGGANGANVRALDEMERQFLINHGNVKPRQIIVGWDKVPVKGKGKGMFKLVPRYETLKPEDMTIYDLKAYAEPMPTSRAQEIKKATYEELRSQYDAGGTGRNIPGWAAGTHEDLWTEGNQEIARALREELNNIYPNLKNLNAKDARLYNLDEALRRFVNRVGNRESSHWGAAWAGTIGAGLVEGGGLLTGHAPTDPAMHGLALLAGASASMIKEALHDPAIRSYLAIAVRQTPWPIKGAITLVGQEGLPNVMRYQGYMRDKYSQPEPTGSWVPRETAQPGQAAAPTSQPETPGVPSQEAAPGATSQEPGQAAPSQPVAPPQAHDDPSRPPLKPLDQRAWDRSREMKDFTGTYGWSNNEERLLQDAAKKYDVPLSLLLTVAEREASGKYAEEHHLKPSQVRSPAGAIGLMQIMPDTAKTFGYDNPDAMLDPAKNIEVAARYLSQLSKNPLYQRNLGMILAAYNAGEGTLKNSGYSLAKMKKETRDYTLRGLRRWAQLSMKPEDLEQYLSKLPTPEEYEKSIPIGQ